MPYYTFAISWPPAPLRSNARTHWARKSDATRAQRTEAFWAAKAAKVVRDPSAVVAFSFHPPDGRRRDIQNMPGAVKAAIDGIADAMGCDDRMFRPRWPDRFSGARKGGQVVIHVSTGDSANTPLLGQIT